MNATAAVAAPNFTNVELPTYVTFAGRAVREVGTGGRLHLRVSVDGATGWASEGDLTFAAAKERQDSEHRFPFVGLGVLRTWHQVRRVAEHINPTGAVVYVDPVTLT